MREYITCPRCGGKGHVWAKDSILLTFMCPIISWIEGDDPDGITRDKCPRCKGSGVLLWLSRVGTR